MKTKFVLFLFLAFSLSAFSQSGKKFPSVDIKDLNGKTVNTNDFVNDEKITIVSFWATWCVPCKRELDVYADIFDEWQEKYGIEIIAVSTDNIRQFAKVKPLVAQKQWPFRVLSDINEDLKKALDFSAVPQTFILDKKGNIVFDHSGFKLGDEYEVEDVLEKLTKK